MSRKGITLEQLFTGRKAELKKIIDETKAGRRAAEVADEYITPILADLEKNAGQEMNATYIAYMVQAVVQRAV